MYTSVPPDKCHLYHRPGSNQIILTCFGAKVDNRVSIASKELSLDALEILHTKSYKYFLTTAMSFEIPGMKMAGGWRADTFKMLYDSEYVNVKQCHLVMKYMFWIRLH